MKIILKKRPIFFFLKILSVKLKNSSIDKTPKIIKKYIEKKKYIYINKETSSNKEPVKTLL